MTKISVILVLFFVVSAIQLYACFPPIKIRLRYATKVLLMPLLGIWFMLALKCPPITILAGFLCGFLGDLFLLGTGKKFTLFVIGSVFFGIGHILYATFFISNTGTLPAIWPIILLSCIYIAAIVVFVILTKDKNKLPLVLAMIAYYTVISVMSVSACAYMLSNGFGYSVIPFVGSVMFLVSDYYLGYDLAYKKLPLRHFLVMLTYIAGQFGIAYGIYLMLH